MAKRQDDKNSNWDTIYILFILFVGIFFLIKFLFEVLVYIIKGMILVITESISLINEKRAMININRGTIIKNNKLTDREIKDQLKLFDTNIYNNYFEVKCRKSGEECYFENKISGFLQDGNSFSCKVSGKKNYDTTIAFVKENDRIIESATCTCSYSKTNNKYCKHVYALLLKAKASDNNKILKCEIKNYIKGIRKALYAFENYINNNESLYSKKNKKAYFDYAKKVEKQLSKFDEQLINYPVKEEDLLAILKQLMTLANEVKKKVRTTISNKKVGKKSKNNHSKNKKKDVCDTKNDEALELTLLDSFSNKRGKDEVDEDLELEMNVYNLEEWQKDLVRQGRYKPWNFSEEDNFGEDDYYHEK